jgi:hypothetical protein
MTPHPPDHGTTRHPRYHGADEDTSDQVGPQPLTVRQRWARVAVIAIVAAVVLAILILHLTGTMGKGMNG